MTRDSEARARIESDLDRSFLVEAAAGTGKTTALVGRIARLVATGRARITEIAAITFTERASGELVLRLRERLELARHSSTDASERARLDEALADFEAAYVGTIHGFCAELLRARPLDAGVDPAFTLLGDDERNALLDETTDRFLEEALRDPPEGIRRALARPREYEPPPPRTVFAREIRELTEHRDQDPALRRDPFDRNREIETLIAAVEGLASRAPETEARGDKLADFLAELRHWRNALADHERTRPRDHDALERELVGLLDAKWLEWTTGTRGKPIGAHARDAIVRDRDALHTALESFRLRANADLAFCLARDLAPAVRLYEARKRAIGVLDHLDSLLRARALLAESKTARIALRERFRFLFVDEVQDVDPIQKDVVLLLAGSDPDEGVVARTKPRPGSLYLVGDPKQAIYGFRRADLRTYLALRDMLVPAHAELLELSASFRPRPAIAALVNHAFASIFDGSIGQAGHVPLEAQRPAMDDFPSVIALPAPRALSDWGNVTRKILEDSVPDAIASFVRWLIDESGLTIEDPSTRAMVPIAPRHVGLLFKTLKDNGSRQARALERHGIAHSFVAPEAFFEREVVIAASALMSAIEWPDDGLSVYATLRGPFLGIPDADLLAYRETVGPLHPLGKASDAGLSNELRVVHTSLKLLGELHRGRHACAIESTVGLFFERCEADVLLLLTERRGEARALEQLRQIARRADVRGTPFRDLARWLSERVDDPTLGGVDVAPDAERLDAVTLLTVHGAKGLELPVIVIADPGTRPQLWKSDASRYSDPTRHALVRRIAHFEPIELRENLAAANAIERAEVMRLLYVAATRARDVLVVPTIGMGEIEDSWLAPLARALVPSDPRAEAQVLPTLPAFGERSMLDDRASGPGVRPGHHAAHLGGVTWWDPRHLLRPLPPRAARGLTHLVERVEGRSARDLERELEAARDRALDDARVGAIEVLSARSAARRPLGATLSTVAVEEIELGPAGATGARFARLVARLAAETDLPQAALHHARVLGASSEERDAAIALVERLRAHPILGPLVTDGRETPYLLASDVGPIVWGRAALVSVIPAGAAAEGLVVVGITVESTIEVARTELSIAAAALERARNQKIRAYLACAR